MAGNGKREAQPGDKREAPGAQAPSSKRRREPPPGMEGILLPTAAPPVPPTPLLRSTLATPGTPHAATELSAAALTEGFASSPVDSGLEGPTLTEEDFTDIFAKIKEDKIDEAIDLFSQNILTHPALAPLTQEHLLEPEQTAFNTAFGIVKLWECAPRPDTGDESEPGDVEESLESGLLSFSSELLKKGELLLAEAILSTPTYNTFLHFDLQNEIEGYLAPEQQIFMKKLYSHLDRTRGVLGSLEERIRNIENYNITDAWTVIHIRIELAKEVASSYNTYNTEGKAITHSNNEYKPEDTYLKTSLSAAYSEIYLELFTDIRAAFHNLATEFSYQSIENLCFENSENAQRER